MTKTRTCIICGGSAGSGEHLFPAALGGRRTHNGIYCQKHNEGFSPFVKIMADQLAFLNGYLEVRHDRKKTPQAPIITASDGSSYSIKGPRFVPQDTRILERGQTTDGREGMTVAVPEHLIGQLKALEAKGDIEILATGRPVTRMQDQKIQFRFKFGGPKFLAAISYVAMTYFAKYHPNLAREKTAGMESLKASLLEAVAKEEDEVAMPKHVWWETPEMLDALPETSFRFSHTIVFTTSQKTRRATAYFSLFGVFCFGIDFGEFGALSDHTVVLHLDPLAPRPPDDLSEHSQPTTILHMAPPEPSLTENLREAMSNGVAEKQLSTFLERIMDWHLENAATALLERVQAIPPGKLTDVASQEAAEQLLVDEGQRVFNMMCMFAASFRENVLQKMPSAVATGLGNAIQAQVATDETMPGGLSQIAAASLLVAKAFLSDKILKERDAGSLTLDKAKMLLGGGEGVAAVGRAMLLPIMGKDLPNE